MSIGASADQSTVDGVDRDRVLVERLAEDGEERHHGAASSSSCSLVVLVVGRLTARRSSATSGCDVVGVVLDVLDEPVDRRLDALEHRLRVHAEEHDEPEQRGHAPGPPSR